MAGNSHPFPFLHQALGSYQSLPYVAANAGNARATRTVADYYRLHVLPALEQIVAARHQRAAPPVPLGFGQMFPTSRPARPARAEVQAAQDDLYDIRDFLMSQLRYSQHLQRRPLLGALPGLMQNSEDMALGKALE